MLKIFRNNYLAILALTAILTAWHPAVGRAQAGNPAVAHLQYALMGDFKLENGRSIDQCTIAYQTFGKLNKEKNNAVLFPTWFTGTSMNLLPFVPGKLIDTTRFFLILVDALGDGLSSSPSNSQTQPEMQFPAFSIRDMVESEYDLLTEHLNIHHLYAVAGVSMGGMQSFQWAVSYPGYMDRIVATSGTAKTYGHGIVRLESEITALTTDEAFKSGDYKEEPVKGIQAFALVWTAWLFSQEWWREELWKSEEPAGTTFAQVVDKYKTNFIPGADANNLILQMHTWERHDVAASPAFAGDLQKALGSIQAQVLYMPSATDLYFPVTDARYEAPMIPHCILLPIPSLWGHPAGAGASPADSKFLNQNIAAFLEGKPLQP